MSTTVIIVAAGRGKRMGGDLPKQFLSVAGRPILYYSLMAFERCEGIDHIVLVVPPAYAAQVQEDIVQRYECNKVVSIVAGGDRRQDSVRNGLAVLPPHTAIVAIHDGVRPCISPLLIRTLLNAASRFEAVIPCMAIKDTIKRIKGDTVEMTINREDLVAVQTPQVFAYELITRAYRRAFDEKIDATDDAALVERLGNAIHTVRGDPRNTKITSPEDITYFEWLIQGGKWVLE